MRLFEMRRSPSDHQSLAQKKLTIVPRANEQDASHAQLSMVGYAVIIFHFSVGIWHGKCDRGFLAFFFDHICAGFDFREINGVLSHAAVDECDSNCLARVGVLGGVCDTINLIADAEKDQFAVFHFGGQHIFLACDLRIFTCAGANEGCQ
jgi:hypothetical protein